MLYNIDANLKNLRIREVTDFLGKIGKYFSITVRDDRISFGQRQEDINRVIKKLSEYEIEIKKSRWWPGNELLEGYADVYIYRCNGGSISLLEQESEFITEWNFPKLPEDLAFYNENMREVFFSTPHENVCQYILSESELKNLNLKKTPRRVDLADYDMIGRFSTETLRGLKRVFIGLADVGIRDAARARKGRYPDFTGGCVLVACLAFREEEFIPECRFALEREGFFLKEIVGVRRLPDWLLLEGLTDSELQSLYEQIGFDSTELDSLHEEFEFEGKEGPYDFWLSELR